MSTLLDMHRWGGLARFTECRGYYDGLSGYRSVLVFILRFDVYVVWKIRIRYIESEPKAFFY